jgi:hypothetical protein
LGNGGDTRHAAGAKYNICLNQLTPPPPMSDHNSLPCSSLFSSSLVCSSLVWSGLFRSTPLCSGLLRLHLLDFPPPCLRGGNHHPVNFIFESDAASPSSRHPTLKLTNVPATALPRFFSKRIRRHPQLSRLREIANRKSQIASRNLRFTALRITLYLLSP